MESIREDFILRPIIPLRKRIKRKIGYVKRLIAEIRGRIRKATPKLGNIQYGILFMIATTHILLFHYMNLLSSRLLPNTFIDRLLTLIASVGLFYMSITIILKVFDSYRKQRK